MPEIPDDPDTLSSDPLTVEPARVLVVDDEPGARAALCELLQSEGYDVQAAADGYKALGRVDLWEPDVLITDISMPALGGNELMAKLRERLPEVVMIAITGHSSIEGAVEALQLGARDYMVKPLQFASLLAVIRRELGRRGVAGRPTGPAGSLAGDGVIGRARALRELVALARQAAAAGVPVLISGERGAGKQHLARLIHRWSPRRGGPLVVVRCGELGDARAAERALRARLVEADRGTLVLADLDELPLPVQARLALYLQDPPGQVAGDDPPVTADVRVVATSSRDLERMLGSGELRADLYYRLGMVQLRTPSLRERREDIAALANHFLRLASARARRHVHGFSERALGVLVGGDWPGNLRQLEHCVERAVAACRGGEIEPRDLPRELMTRAPGDEAPKIPGASLRELERHAILRTLEYVGGSTSQAAKLLGISPRKIQYRLSEYRGEPGGPPK
jgi:two-component system response regulator HydG